MYVIKLDSTNQYKLRQLHQRIFTMRSSFRNRDTCICKLLIIEPYTKNLKKENKDNLVLHNNKSAMNFTNVEEDNHSHSFIHIEIHLIESSPISSIHWFFSTFTMSSLHLLCPLFFF